MDRNEREDRRYMDMAIELARKGLGDTYPNPVVGCVIVSEGRVIGSGYHRRAGEPHAEVNAVRSVGEGSCVSGSTMYVTLEPCAHYGKTPPCADMIVRQGVSRVVIGALDPFERVNGRGIERLRRAGIEVVFGVREAECREVNKRFFTYHEKKRPYVVLKWAQTADGFVDIERESPDTPPLKITGEDARRYVHALRSVEQSILVGGRTAWLDNPRLDARLASNGRHPLRVALDRRGNLPSSWHLLDGTHPTLIFVGKEAAGRMPADRPNTEYVPIDFSPDSFIARLLDELYRRSVQSVLVEGGAALLASFFRAGLWDEAFVFEAPGLRIGRGVCAPRLPASAQSIRRETIARDNLTVYKNKSALL